MKQLISSVVIVAFVSIILVACSGENKPATGELKATLTQAIPGHVELTNFSVQACQNFGNKVEPIYGTRFNATVIALVDLYKTDKKDKEVAFVRLVTEKGKQTDIFGKITSKLYQGAWKHNIDIDGTPIRNLGIPLNQVSAGRVIVRGSDEEKIYYAEIERKENERRAEKERKLAELRKNMANAKKILIGTWRDDNSSFTLKSDGTQIIKFDSGAESITTWDIDGDTYIEKVIKSKSKDGDWKPSKKIYKYRITYVDKNRFVYMSSAGKTYTSKRIK